MRIAPPRLKSARADGTGPKPKLQRDHRTYLRRHRRDVSRVCTPSGVPSLTPCATLWLGAMHRAAADARVGPLNGSFVACARNCKHAALKRGRVGVARAERWCCIPSRACRRPRCTARLPASHNTHARTHAHARHGPIRSGDSTQRRRRARTTTPCPSGCNMQHATCNIQNTKPGSMQPTPYELLQHCGYTHAGCLQRPLQCERRRRTRNAAASFPPVLESAVEMRSMLSALACTETRRAAAGHDSAPPVPVRPSYCLRHCCFA